MQSARGGGGGGALKQGLATDQRTPHPRATPPPPPRPLPSPHPHAALAPIQWGEVRDIIMLKDKATGQPRGCAFVSFAMREEAETAIQQLDRRVQLPGALSQLEVRRAPGKRSGAAAPRCGTPGALGCGRCMSCSLRGSGAEARCFAARAALIGSEIARNSSCHAHGYAHLHPSLTPSRPISPSPNPDPLPHPPPQNLTSHPSPPSLAPTRPPPAPLLTHLHRHM
jgi:RNA recognition motif-containing protein